LRVGRTSSRREFLDAGEAAFHDVIAAMRECAREGETYGRWLDFGCGCGRFARHVERLPEVVSLHGVDVDARAIGWLQRHSWRGSYLAIGENPPIPFPDASFDCVCAISVFTHLPEGLQLAWLGEIRRLLRPGGLLLASTHSEQLTFTLPFLTAGQHEELRQRGFLFVPGLQTYKEDGTFHTLEYLARRWSELFDLVIHKPLGLAGFQDLSVWRRPAELSIRNRLFPSTG
jgi:SAM-dependent methyltransferase